ncbi:MAG: ABC transporter ATP-binding protein [Pseudomonadota bacterium]
MSALLDAQVERKAFGGTPVLSHLHLTLEPGEIVSLVGASGCGKSTLLRIIAGLDTDYRGSVQLEGQPVQGVSRAVGFIFQEPRLFPWLTVAENVAFDLGRAGRKDARALALLDEVGLAGLDGRLPKQLSGGQAQRVAIARGLYTQPRVLLLDEPFSAVDAFTRMKLQDLLVSLALRHGITVLLVTHDVEEAVLLSDRVLVLEAEPGRIAREVSVGIERPRAREGEGMAPLRAQVLQALHAAHAL